MLQENIIQLEEANMSTVEYGDKRKTVTARQKIFAAFSLGLIAGILAARLWAWQIALLAAWDVSLIVYLLWTWATVWSMDYSTTASHAVREDPSRALADSIMLFVVVGSLVAVGFMLVESSSFTRALQLLGIAFSLASVILSWITLHTLFMLHYAEEYYRSPRGGVDFGDTKNPTYHDFAYLALTIGMTFQVSDTQLSRKKIRRIALKHALLSYIFGTLIIAATVNLVAGLGK